MKNKPNTNTHEANQTQTPLKAKSIKLGIDVHADSYRAAWVSNAEAEERQNF